MRIPFVAATLTAAALTLAGHHRPACAAEAAPKPPDRVTIGAAAHPDPLTAVPRATLLARVPGATHAEFVTPAPAQKPESFGVASRFDAASLSPEQQRKLAAGRIPIPATLESGVNPNGKPVEFSTIAPRAADAPALSEAERAGLKQASLPGAAAAPERLHAGSPAAALGLIPRPEWSAGAAPKPQDVATMGSAAAGTTPAARPGAPELQGRATSKLKASGAAKAPKATTSAPRDPSLAPAPAVKARRGGNPEVQR